MITFKTFFKILSKYKISINIYLGIFIAMMFVMININTDEKTTDYEDQSISVAVIDRDGSKISEGIGEYIKAGNNEVELEDDILKIKNSVFMRETYYAVIIPEGFGSDFAKSVKEGKEPPKLGVYKLNDAIQCYNMDIRVNAYMKALKTYLGVFDEDEALKKAEKTAGLKTRVAIYTGDKDKEDEVKVFSAQADLGFVYFSYLPYIIVAIITSAVCPIILVFSGTDVRKRTEISAEKFSRRNFEIYLGIAVFTLIIDVVFAAAAWPVCHADLTVGSYVLYVINMLVFSLVSIGIAYLGGQLFKNPGTVAAFSTTVSLGIAFLGGVFVPLAYLGDSMKKLAHVIPAYYYIVAAEEARNYTSGMSLKTFTVNIVIEIIFAALIFAAGLMMSAKHRREEAR